MKVKPFDQMKSESKREPVAIRVTELGTVQRQGRVWTAGEVLRVHPCDARRLIDAGSAEAV
jgi:hypothetical protein